jgi:hypothetical protein
MLRTILTPEHTDIHLTIPEAYIGKPVEVTFLALDELERQRRKTMNDFFSSKPKTRLSDKYRGVFSKDAGKSFKEHTQLMREEWNNI